MITLFLTGRVPELGLDEFAVELDSLGGELNADGGFGLQVEFLFGVLGQEIGFSDRGIALGNEIGGVTYDDNFKEIVIFSFNGIGHVI